MSKIEVYPPAIDEREVDDGVAFECKYCDEVLYSTFHEDVHLVQNHEEELPL